jgi:hypothetical protein
MTTLIEFSDFGNVVLTHPHTNIVLGYGTGDTFNALIHLQKYPPRSEYSLIVKAPQSDLVQFMLRLFERPPVSIICIPYWKHDFSVKLATHFPSIPFARGFEPHSTWQGLIDLWQNPFNYQRLAPLGALDLDRIRHLFSNSSLSNFLEPHSTVFFTTAGANFSQYIPDWKRFSEFLKSVGAPNVYANRSGVKDYGEEVIEGVPTLDLKHSELIQLFYSQANINIVGVRSGVLDILRFSRQKALVLYQPVPAGIFETCRFGLIDNDFDLVETICLPNNHEFQHSVVEYYLKHFIASRV